MVLKVCTTGSQKRRLRPANARDKPSAARHLLHCSIHKTGYCALQSLETPTCTCSAQPALVYKYRLGSSPVSNINMRCVHMHDTRYTVQSSIHRVQAVGSFNSIAVLASVCLPCTTVPSLCKDTRCKDDAIDDQSLHSGLQWHLSARTMQHKDTSFGNQSSRYKEESL